MATAPRPERPRGRRRVFVALAVGLTLAIVFAGVALFALDNPLRGFLGGPENEAVAVDASGEAPVALDELGLDTFHNEHATFQIPAGWEAQERPPEDEFADPDEIDSVTLDFVGPGDAAFELTYVRTQPFDDAPIPAIEVLTSVESSRDEEHEDYEQVTLEEVPGEGAGGLDAAYSEGVYTPDELTRLVDGSPEGKLTRVQLATNDGERIHSLILIGPQDLMEDSEAAATIIDSFRLTP
ncbi:hypothetical protein J4H86_04790 [Spiractinospora alimapuensis]|uniref:hypothetical protein n=1 Tax=Spiractinospora alimapuensis TaxID=2820884 RepID=UPI001F44D23D|nr:hypothetical protein [Spiractinospora alimapuensis]QVQ53114.1 hypothetical protein J4H86_04790 [Spiractinospora alimapuensis]